LLRLCEEHGVELVVLARYMQVSNFEGTFVNEKEEGKWHF